MQTFTSIKSHISRLVGSDPVNGEIVFKPIGVAARLVVSNLTRRLDSDRAFADLQSGGLQ
jgi:hypothetical protein